MPQGAAEADSPGWGWDGDGDGDEDWGGAVRALLGLAVVAATVLAWRWLGAGQDQEAAGPAATAPRPSQGGGAGPALSLKSKVSGGVEGHSCGQGKPDPPGCGQGSPAAAEAQAQEPPGGGGLAIAIPPRETPGEVASGGSLGRQHGNATPEAPRGKGRETRRPGAALLGRSKAKGMSAPVLIHFSPWSPGRDVELQVEAGGVRAKAPAHKATAHTVERDTSPWQQGVGSPGSLGRGPGSKGLQVDRRSGARPRRSLKRAPLSRGAAVSVWDAVGAASSLPAGSQGLPFPQELPPSHTLNTRPPTDVLEKGQGKSSPQPVPVLALDSEAKADESREAGTLAPRESQGSPASMEGWPWGSQEGQFSTSWGNLISMVLRSHPFPRPDRPQGIVPRAALESPREPRISTPSENRESASPPEEAVPIREDRHGSAGLVTGDLAEAGARPQPSSIETSEAPTAGPPLGPRGESIEEKHPDSLPRAAEPRVPSRPPEQTQPGPAPSPVTRRDSQPVPRPRKRSLCEISQSSEHEASPAAPGQRRGQVPREGPGPAGSGQVLTEKQKEARKLMVFLQRPGGWGVVEGPQTPRASAVALPRWLDLGSCLQALAFAQQHGDPGLAQETYSWMSENLLHVLGDPSLYRQLSGAERERILSLRTGRGQAALGVLVLPSLYRVSRSGLTRDPRGEEAPAVGPAPPPPRTYLHVFHPGENTWRPLTQVPPEAPLRGCGLCTLHNYLFLAGGLRGSGAEAVCSNEVFCYNPLTDIWSRVRPMQQARAQLKLVALDGLLYAIGGECLYSMERYDPRTDAWTSCAPLPAGTFPVAHEAVACQGDIYVTGGHLFYRLLRYSPAKDTWDECPYSASHRRSSDMVALGGFLYRFDLLHGVGAAVMRYNTVTSSWSRAASLPLPDPAPLRCAVVGNTIYCLNHQVTATLTVSEGTAQFQAKELQPFPLGIKGVLCPFILTLPPGDPLQTAL
ncbi:kelch domain-containing protein 7B [Hippopotamus amphibius kiboko]|uniref:kelch domain-containing protein 7B n=1 Tax=Hippopotamus amphibius kiboko TaxID=575201 RepID=UPI00259A00F3|nr:kelch domain-containing protein 7B [Hippopotamus amphibius kiboko]